MHPLFRVFPGALVVLLSVVCVQNLEAQAGPTASRRASFAGFGEVAIQRAGYRPSTNAGVVLGGTFTVHTLRYLSPSLEARGSYTRGSDVALKTILGGIRLEPKLERIHPYGNVLVGRGSIVFVHPGRHPDGSLYSNDDSIIFNYGGGLQYDLRENWAVQAEFQRQEWNLGGNPQVRFHPNGFNFGVVYRIPFRAHPTD
jgi:hypothetical protein